MHIVNDVLYTTCLSDSEARQKWTGPLGIRDETILKKNGGKGLNSRIVRWDLKVRIQILLMAFSDGTKANTLQTDEAYELVLTAFPENTERAFQVGFDVAPLWNGKLVFYIINLLPTGSVIQKFQHIPGQKTIKYIKTLPVPGAGAGYPYAPNPNDVYIIPDSSATEIIVTNDHATYANNTWERKAEDYLRQKKSWITSYSDRAGTWAGVGKDATNLRLVNGITGPKYDADRNYVYVSELGDGKILVYKRNRDPSNGRAHLDLVQKIPIDFMGDNPSLSYPDEEDLYIIGHTNPHHIRDHVLNVDNPATQPFSGGRASRISTAQIERGFFGTKGETAAPTVEKLFVDPKGVLFNVSSTAIFWKHPIEEGAEELREDAEEGDEVDDPDAAELDVGVGNLRKGDLLVTGLLQKGIWRCKDFPA